MQRPRQRPHHSNQGERSGPSFKSNKAERSVLAIRFTGDRTRCAGGSTALSSVHFACPTPPPHPAPTRLLLSAPASISLSLCAFERRKPCLPFTRCTDAGHARCARHFRPIYSSRPGPPRPAPLRPAGPREAAPGPRRAGPSPRRHRHACFIRQQIQSAQTQHAGEPAPHRGAQRGGAGRSVTQCGWRGDNIGHA